MKVKTNVAIIGRKVNARKPMIQGEMKRQRPARLSRRASGERGPRGAAAGRRFGPRSGPQGAGGLPARRRGRPGDRWIYEACVPGRLELVP